MTARHAARTAPGEQAPERILDPLEVHRSTLRTWLISLAAIPAIVMGVDVLWRQRIVAWMTERVFDSDPQLLEPRDHIWAWALVIVGSAVVLWGLKELFFPAPVLTTDDDGLEIRMLGPFRPATSLRWNALHDIDAGTLTDDGDEVDVLIIEVNDPSLLPQNPWAARRVQPATVALFTAEWEMSAEEVAGRIADQAIRMARRRETPSG